jgi:hypothetical protein
METIFHFDLTQKKTRSERHFAAGQDQPGRNEQWSPQREHTQKRRNEQAKDAYGQRQLSTR